MTDDQETFSFETLDIYSNYIFATFNNYVTGDCYDDVTSQVRVPLLCDDGKSIAFTIHWQAVTT